MPSGGLLFPCEQFTGDPGLWSPLLEPLALIGVDLLLLVENPQPQPGVNLPRLAASAVPLPRPLDHRESSGKMTRLGLRAMPINKLFRDGKIKPKDVGRLNHAFTFALSMLGLVDRNDPICEIVARKVIEIDAAGTHDPREIGTLAAKQLGPT